MDSQTRSTPTFPHTPDDQLDIGLRYLRGEGVKQDDTEAVAWISESARRGNPEAMRHLASLYFSGTGLPQCHVSAYIWIMNAYETGDPVAAAILAEFFCMGLVVERSFPMALFLYEEAASKGHTPSRLLLKKLKPKKPGKLLLQHDAVMDVNLAIINGDLFGHFKKQALAQTMSTKKFAALNAASMAKILTPWNFFH